MNQGGGGNQTVTQQNIPDWAMGFGRQTLDFGDQYTMNPNYRVGALDRDYSGVRGYNAQGQPNSQVGQFGLNPSPAQQQPESVTTNPSTGGIGGGFGGASASPFVKFFADHLQSPLNLGRGSGSQPGVGIADRVGANVLENDAQRQEMLRQREGNGTMQSPQGFRGKPGTGLKFADQMPTSGRNAVRSSAKPENYLQNVAPEGTQPGNVNPDGTPVEGGKKTDKPDYVPTTYVDENGEYTAGDRMTPFQAFDRQRFAAPGQDTLRGEGILAGRYNQRFGPGGTDPFADANAAVGRAADYQSGFQGTTGEGQIGGQAGNYQTNLANASNPEVFQSGDYTAGLPNYANPNANQTNVNAAMGNVNAGLQANTFSNANAGLTGPKNYNQNFQTLVNQSMNPYQDQVVNQTISDLDRARRISENDIRGQAAKAGAFGSREELLRAENNRNYLDRVAAATGQLRQQGFESAANRASQENLQRLGLTAQDLQQTRGLQSQGNLAAQGLTARDAQDVRGLQSQGALAAQGLQSQGGLAAQGLQSQGALAALNANAGLYQSALGLNAAGDRSAMGYNAGLLSDAMGLDAADLNQRRNLASTEAQFAENALRNAGALNLSGGQALGQLAQAGTADERQRIADMLAAGQAGDARNQQDLDFIFSEFNRELDYPGRQIDLRNAAISPATGSIVTTSQPRYQSNPLLGGLGAGISTYAMTSNPYLAGAAGLLSYLNDRD